MLEKIRLIKILNIAILTFLRYVGPILRMKFMKTMSNNWIVFGVVSVLFPNKDRKCRSNSMHDRNRIVRLIDESLYVLYVISYALDI